MIACDPAVHEEAAGCLIAVVWLLRQAEDAITVQEMVDLYCTACRTPAGS
jgi:hypothetical protein